MIAAIETPRLRLVPMSLEFLERSLAGDRAAAERALGVAPDEAWWDETALMALRAAQLRADATLAAWSLRAVVRKEDGRMIGHFNAHDRPGAEHLRAYAADAVELGYTIYPAFRRQGFAREIIEAFAGWSAGLAGALVLSIAPHNEPSLRLAARLGFRQVGEARDESGVEWVFLRENADPGAHLDLWRRGLGVVPDRVCAQRGLETLVLADNDLVTLPAALGALRDLRVLDLGHNALRAVPATLGGLSGLDFLYLHDNRLSELPAELGRLGRLRYLNLSENRLGSLPASIGELAALVELRAAHNRLAELPAALGRLGRLRELHLGSNELRALPEEIGALGALRELHLRDNQLRALPETIGALRMLRLLDLRGNPLTSLPRELADLPALEKLDLRWTPTLTPPPWLAGLEARGVLIYR